MKKRVPPAKQTATLAVEKRKQGQVVTVVRGLAAADNDQPDPNAKSLTPPLAS